MKSIKKKRREKNSYESVLVFCVEAGAGLAAVKVSVPVYLGLRVEFLKPSQYVKQADLLELSASVLQYSVGRTPAHIDDADRIGVVVLDMGADQVDVTAFVNAAVQIDDVVVADVLPAAGEVPAADVGYGDVLELLSVGAMHDDGVDFPLRLLPSKRYEFGKGGRADDAVDREAVVALEGTDRFLGNGTEYAVDDDLVATAAQGALYLLHGLAT